MSSKNTSTSLQTYATLRPKSLKQKKIIVALYLEALQVAKQRRDRGTLKCIIYVLHIHHQLVSYRFLVTYRYFNARIN